MTKAMEQNPKAFLERTQNGVMNKESYLALLKPVVADYRKRDYAFWLPYLSGNPIVFDIACTKGIDCCIEINAFWDDKPNGDVRVTFSIGDGSSWRAFVPVTDSFIITPDGSFVGVK